MTIDPKEFRPEFIRRELEALDAAKNRKCLKCPNVVPSYVKLPYCSGECINAGKAEGTYEKEDSR